MPIDLTSMPAPVKEVLQTAFDRIQPYPSAELLWQKILTAAERKKLGRNLDEAFKNLGTHGMWVELRGGSGFKAILEVARKLDHVSEQDYVWLLRELGLEANPISEPNRPYFDHNHGKLFFGNKSIRRVRMNKNPTHIQIILDAFQEAGWVPRIENPLKGDEQRDQQQLHQVLRSLNDGLKKIKFHALEGGQAIRWELG